MALNWQTWTLRFGAGQNQKSDPRALEAPDLERLVDAQFDELGGLQTRYPFAELGSDIFGGGTLSNIRRVVENGDELLVFTKDALYSWNAQLEKWVQKGTHLAVKVDEASRFTRPGDQVDCDRAELNGTIVYTWTESVPGGSYGYAAAIDKTTGAVLMAPTRLAGSALRLRVVALSTKILLSFYDGLAGIYAYALDPASPATALAGSSTTLTNTSVGFGAYDIERVPGADQAVFAVVRNPTTSYTVGTVTGALVVTTSTKARTCTGMIAVSCPPTGTHVQVVRANGTDVQGDLIAISGLSDVYTAQAIGTTPTNASLAIACAHRSVQNGGQYRCYVFWSSDETTGGAPDWFTSYNWVDTGNTLGTAATFAHRLAPRSRAFDHDGSVYVWMAFFGSSAFFTSSPPSGRNQLQNTYFLFRDDGFLCAKAISQRAGVFGGGIAKDGTGWLPGITSTSDGVYAFCGVERRIISVGTNSSGYGARAPRDVVVTFDSNEARRTARLGQSLYIAAGEVLQYDGALTEVGFHIFPYRAKGTPNTASGAMEAGDYAYKMTWRWENARGELDRSTTASVGLITIAGGTAPDSVDIEDVPPLMVTHKENVVAEVWRTLKNPTDDAPFYLVTSKDPADTSGANCYLESDSTADFVADFNDALADVDAAELETNPENGAILENLAPPAASIIIASDTRLFLAGIPGDPDRVWYSKLRGDGEVASFHDALTVQIPIDGGDITGLALLNRTLVVFRESAIYVCNGEGFDNAGGGFNFSVDRIPGNVGAVNHESIAVTERGIVFKSDKGWYLTNGQSVQYIGAGVSDYDNETPLAVQVLRSQHQVRVLTSSRMIVFDTLLETWRAAEWSVNDGVHACMWRGAHVYASGTMVKQQLTTYTGVDYGIVMQLAWVKLNDLQGYGAIDYFDLLGEYRSACTVRLVLARDYWRDGVDTAFQDKTHTPTGTAGMPLEIRHRPSIRQVKALKVQIMVTPTAAGESVKLTGIAFRLGMQPGLTRNVAQARKQ